jgi:hypothetical protein
LRTFSEIKMRQQKQFYLLACLSALLLFAANQLRAQGESYVKDVSHKPEISLTFGANNFLGDLGGNLGKGEPFLKDYLFKTVRPLVGLSLAYYPKNWYQIKTGFNYTSVDGADSLIPVSNTLARWRYYRNLSFNSHIFEGYITGQFYPLTFFSDGRDVQRLSPFIEGGIGFFHFNPTTQLNGQTVYLQPLHTEGEGFPGTGVPNYSLTQVYIPASIGVKYYMNDELSISVGATFRKTFTDYIDDVSGNYISNPDLFNKYLSPTEAALALQLYKRVLPQYESKVGTLRGFSSSDDTYLTFFLTISMTIQRFVNFYYGGHDYNRDGQLLR